MWREKDLIDLWIEMVATDSGRVKPFTGHLVRGTLLALIRNADPELAQRLHEPHQQRPYSVTPAKPVAQPMSIRENLWWIRPGDHVRFHAGFLQDHIGEKTFQKILESRPEIKLGETPFTPVRIELKRTTYEELVKTAQPEEIVTMRFTSPTQFTIRARDFPLLFPDPRYLYGSLAQLWNKNAPPQIRVDTDELHKWVEEHVYIRKYRLQTREIDVGKLRRLAGFTGTLEYLLNSTEGYASWINVLTRYATTANTGAKRTSGMGATQKIEHPKTLKANNTQTP
ncbi:MAG: CRISPR system precrRNA processing endoribonuclease RAMP protein Cas6 [Candidatus Jordarchaeum sp.]|uniref:CRISPR system precrRNA processing endoribonuclease RAMP protein Cas6 n=1 Tax=Candidatus Jordarchaeum sp. TaxID=2823881 RepID=UPI00404B5A74